MCASNGEGNAVTTVWISGSPYITMRMGASRTATATSERVGGGKTRYLASFLTRGVEIHGDTIHTNGEKKERKRRAGKVGDAKALLDPRETRLSHTRADDG
jgi:hypothetical protein